MRQRIFLLIIIFLAVALRFFQLGVNPPSLTWDEVSWGYNAYSLGIDSRDEFGRYLPHDYLESFGDFKPPVYAYLDIIPVKIFGLNEFSTRFPSAFFGVLTVWLTYFLTKEIFRRSLHKENVALTASLLLAISPWHINVSRAAFEANVSSFFIVLGVFSYIAAIQGRKWFLIMAAVSFALSIYTFNTARVVCPLLILFITLISRRQLMRIKKEVLLAILIGGLMVLPSVKFLLSPQASLRFKEVNIFSDITVIERVNREIDNDHNAFWSKIIHNRRLAYGVLFFQHYLDNINPTFLFVRGDGNPKFSTQDVGQLYAWELPFLLIGVLFLFKRKEGVWWILPLWFLLGIVPAATARETPHALRIETTLPTLQIVTAYGLAVVMGRLFQVKHSIAKLPTKNLLFLAFFLISLFNFLYYLHGYYTHYPREFSGEWQYGYKESIEYVKSVEKNYDTVLITNALGRPYVYYLFYLKVKPSDFRMTARVKRDAFGFVNVESVGKYKFGSDLHALAPKNSRNLYINSAAEVPEGVKIIKTFNLLNGQPMLVAYEK